MSTEQKMIDTATGASPSLTCTRDVACYPIHFGSLIQLIPIGDFDQSPIIFHQEKQTIQKDMVTKKYVHPSSIDTTPVLESISSNKTVIINVEFKEDNEQSFQCKAEQ